MARPVLLDTCAAIWLMNGDKMSPEGLAAIAAAQAGNMGVYVSPITAWEIATLAAKNKLQLALSPEAWFATLDRAAGRASRRSAAGSPHRLGQSAGNAAEGSCRPDHRRHGPRLWSRADHARRRADAVRQGGACRGGGVFRWRRSEDPARLAVRGLPTVGHSGISPAA